MIKLSSNLPVPIRYCLAIPIVVASTLTYCHDRFIVRAPYTITEPGLYCLADDVTGTITITAPDVRVNMGGHKLYGSFEIYNNFAAISNGFLAPAAFDPVPDAAITVHGAAANILTDIALENLTIGHGHKAPAKRFSKAIAVNGTQNLSMNNIAMMGNEIGVALTNVRNAQITNSTVVGCCSSTGWLISSSENILLSACTAEDINSLDSAAAGFMTTGACSKVIIQNCIVNNISGLQASGYLLAPALASSTITNSKANKIYGVEAAAGIAAQADLLTVPELVATKQASLTYFDFNPDARLALGIDTLGRLTGYTFDLDNLVPANRIVELFNNVLPVDADGNTFGFFSTNPVIGQDFSFLGITNNLPTRPAAYVQMFKNSDLSRKVISNVIYSKQATPSQLVQVADAAIHALAVVTH